jgi:hypothetical protein
MRTIATLNLPASTSGICTPVPAPAVQELAAPVGALDPLGDPWHAVATSNPANRVLMKLNRRLTIDLLLLDAWTWLALFALLP